MRELGIDISRHRSKPLDEFTGVHFDYVFIVCDNAKESRPVFLGNTIQIHQSFEDPAEPSVGLDEEQLVVFRRVRDELRRYLKKVYGNEGYPRRS